jgi:hypothetical protein
MAAQQDYEMVKALKDIAYELKRIADAIYEERSKHGQGQPAEQPVDHKSSER